jgi:hypothetical protein
MERAVENRRNKRKIFTLSNAAERTSFPEEEDNRSYGPNSENAGLDRP